MKNFSIVSKLFLLVLALAMVMLSCKKDDDNDIQTFPVEDHERAEVLEAKSMGIFTVEDIQQLIDETGTDLQFALYHPVEAFSVKYYSVDRNGNDILVSGALYVPQSGRAMPMMSIQHGTITKYDHVASVSPHSSTEGIVGLMTASMGFFSVVADYPGFGVSNSDHPYLHAASIVPSVVDFIMVGKQYCIDNAIKLKNEVYMTGYSEGGFISLAAQKVIEESYSNEINLAGVAPMAGPYDMYGTFEKIFEDGSYSTPAYVAYVLKSYNDIYHWNRLSSFFKPQYASIVNGLFDGTKAWYEVENALPASLEELMHPDFIDNYYLKEESVVTKALIENTLLDWTPKAPIHFFHGDCDDIVFCMNANNAKEQLIANGARDVQLTILSGENHETAGPLAIAAAIAWIEDFQPDL